MFGPPHRVRMRNQINVCVDLMKPRFTFAKFLLKQEFHIPLVIDLFIHWDYSLLLPPYDDWSRSLFYIQSCICSVHRKGQNVQLLTLFRVITQIISPFSPISVFLFHSHSLLLAYSNGFLWTLGLRRVKGVLRMLTKRREKQEVKPGQ